MRPCWEHRSGAAAGTRTALGARAKRGRNATARERPSACTGHGAQFTVGFDWRKHARGHKTLPRAT
eukprot:8838270-Pyramimonas_sp.AAC.1